MSKCYSCGWRSREGCTNTLERYRECMEIGFVNFVQLKLTDENMEIQKMNKNFKLNDEVMVNLPAFQGKGKIKGIQTSQPIIGHIYIVECPTVYNEVYPYECICVPEVYISRVIFAEGA